MMHTWSHILSTYLYSTLDHATRNEHCSDKLSHLLPIFFVPTKYVSGTETQHLQQVFDAMWVDTVTLGFGRQIECEPCTCQDQKFTYTVIT
jgi:hypothetical protein